MINSKDRILFNSWTCTRIGINIAKKIKNSLCLPLEMLIYNKNNLLINSPCNRLKCNNMEKINMGKWIRVLYRDKCKILSRLICHSRYTYKFRYHLINNNYNIIPSLQLNNNNFIHNREPNLKYHKISLQIKFNKDQYNIKSRYNSRVFNNKYLNNKLLSNNSLTNNQVFNNK